MKNWIERKQKETPNHDDSIIDKIAKIRGIKDVNRFLNPSKEEMFDPYRIKNIETVSERIIEAIDNNEKICVSYDADADGLTSASIMIRYLKNYTNNVDFIYNERNHGHGIYEQTRLDFITSDDVDENGEIINEEKKLRRELNNENLDRISNSDLLIIIDSSSNDADACKKLIDEFGIDIIIIDHHDIEIENPYVLMVNPQQKDCEYPNKYLSGAGMVFKVLQVIEDILDDKGKVDPFEYMDLVAVGMYADVMRVDVLENRYMIMHGLRNIRNVGLTRILKGGKVNLFNIDCTAIGFTIAPLLNGVARLDNIKLAIDILLEDDDAKCKPIRLKMQKLNEKRKVMQKEIVEQYSKNIDTDKKALIVLDEQSSKGFNGLVAQQLSNTYKRPALVGRLYRGVASGSFRSYDNFKLKSFLQEFDGEIEVMGHEQAGGYEIKEEYLPKLEKYIEDNLPNLKDKEPTFVYDIEIDVSEIPEYVKAMGQFNLIYGNGYPKIVVKVNNITVEEAECIGKTRETVKIKTLDDMELIKFRVDENYASELGYFDTLSVVGELRLNSWYNFAIKQKIEIPQVMIDDYKVI